MLEPEKKFNIGDTVYYMDKGVLCSSKITRITRMRNSIIPIYVLENKKTATCVRIFLTEKEALERNVNI